MKWKLKFNRPTKSDSQRMGEIARKEKPTDEEQQEFIRLMAKKNPKLVEETIKKLQEVENP